MGKTYSFDAVVSLVISDADYFEFVDLDRDKVINELNDWIYDFKDIDDFSWVFSSEDLADIREHFKNTGYRKFI